jgi:predicted adenylyl cyclase CyaB
MPVEIEIKLKVDELAPVRDRLGQLGATRVGEVLETNIFFDTADRALLASDCGLRLRVNRDIASGSEKLKITYKGPRAEGPVKSREEIEVSVDSTDAAVELLERLGYTRMLTFEKRRETWTIEKNCSIELDTLPQIGSFVEIECKSQADVLRIRETLALADVAAVLPTYADLVARHLNDRGKRGEPLRFE